MAEQGTGLVKATQFQIDVLVLMSSTGRSIDLRLVMRELNIFEDLFSNVMSGTIAISDAQDMINKLGLIGAEYLIVELTKPTMPGKLTKVFRVYKFSDRKRNGTFTEDYLLHFCSEELLIDSSVKISKAYKGRSVSDMVTDIARSHLGITTTKFPPNAITPTKQIFDIVVPMWSPFYTINWLARFASTGSDNGSSFLFFEDSQGFHFQSVEALIQQEPVQILNYMPANFRGEKTPQKTDMQQKFESIESFEITEGPDILKSISMGRYAGKLVTVNTMSQQVGTMSMDAGTLFKSTKHLEPFSTFSTARDRTGMKQTEHYESYLRVRHDSLGATKWVLQRNAYLAGIHTFRVKTVVPGHFGLRVGQVVDVNLPAALKNDTAGVQEDTLYVGKYLITSIRHKIDREQYVCILELSKDAVSKNLLPALQDNPGLTKMRKL